MPHFNPINKHLPLITTGTCANYKFVIRTCNVMTDDGATLFDYVKEYATISCKGQVWAWPRIKPFCVIDCSFVTKEKNYSDEQL